MWVEKTFKAGSLMIFCLVLANCQDQGQLQGESNSSLDNASLVAMKMSEGEEQELLFDEGDEESIEEGSDEGVEQDIETDNEPTVEGPKDFICVLSGPGKSVRLGVVDNEFAEHGKTPGVVCMSEIACTEQIARVFEVKGPHKRGFCPNKNPNVHTLSYEEIEALVDSVVKE